MSGWMKLTAWDRAKVLKKTADLNDNRFLRPDASNLAPFLFYLMSKHEASYWISSRCSHFRFRWTIGERNPMPTGVPVIDQIA